MYIWLLGYNLYNLCTISSWVVAQIGFSVFCFAVVRFLVFARGLEKSAVLQVLMAPRQPAMLLSVEPIFHVHALIICRGIEEQDGDGRCSI